MANLKEQEKWEDGVYQIEENDPVLGGENGITNKPIKQLANRTLWLKKALELFGKKSAPKDLTANSTSTADESGHSHKLPVGSTTQKGIWQATSDTGLDSEGLVLTAKGGKKLAQLIATVQLALSNYIPNSKKSSSVDSNSADDVATSAAVKTAYDKAVAAKNVADNAVAIENDATYQNSRIRIGWLRTSPYGAYLLVDNTNQGRIVTDDYLSQLVNSTNNKIPASVAGVKIAYDKAVDVENKALMKTGGVVTGDVDFKKSDWSGVNFYNTALDFVRLEGNPAGSNYALTIAYRSQGKALYAAYLPKKNGEILLNRGDTQIYGRHFFESDNSWISVRSTTADTAGYDLTIKNGKYPHVTYAAGKVGNYGVEARIFVTPEGANFDTDRRQHVFSVGEGGVMWTLKYGLLHDYFHHAGKNYVTVKQDGGLAGLHINRSNGKRARFELINDTKWKFWLEDKYDIFMPERGGTVALNDDFVGMVAYFATPTAPTGFLKCNGAAVSRATYAALFARIGTTFGAGDGRTTFNLPDLRGEFLRCLDDGRNIDGGRRLGTAQSDAIKTHTINVPDSGSAGNNMGMWFYGERGGPNDNGHNTITYNGESETRPRNVALLACIKY